MDRAPLSRESRIPPAELITGLSATATRICKILAGSKPRGAGARRRFLLARHALPLAIGDRAADHRDGVVGPAVFSAEVKPLGDSPARAGVGSGRLADRSPRCRGRHSGVGAWTQGISTSGEARLPLAQKSMSIPRNATPLDRRTVEAQAGQPNRDNTVLQAGRRQTAEPAMFTHLAGFEPGSGARRQ